jgi:hypothetical protein
VMVLVGMSAITITLTIFEAFTRSSDRPMTC